MERRFMDTSHTEEVRVKDGEVVALDFGHAEAPTQHYRFVPALKVGRVSALSPQAGMKFVLESCLGLRHLDGIRCTASSIRSCACVSKSRKVLR